MALARWHRLKGPQLGIGDELRHTCHTALPLKRNRRFKPTLPTPEVNLQIPQV